MVVLAGSFWPSHRLYGKRQGLMSGMAPCAHYPVVFFPDMKINETQSGRLFVSRARDHLIGQASGAQIWRKRRKHSFEAAICPCGSGMDTWSDLMTE